MRKLLCIMLILCLLPLPAVAEENLPRQWDSVARIECNEDLFLICEDGLWGVADRSGGIVIEPCFREMPAFDGRFAVVKVLDPVVRTGFSDEDEYGSLYGMIDINGNIIIPAEYDDLEIIEDVAVWVRAGDRYGFMNMKGEDLTGLKYTDIRALDNEYTAVTVPNEDRETGEPRELWGVFYHGGREVLPCVYESVKYVDEGKEILAAAPGNNAGYTLFRLRNGTAIDLTSADAAEGNSLLDGYDQVKRIEGAQDRFLVRSGGLWGMAGADGSEIIPPRFSKEPEFVGGHAVVCIPDPNARQGFSGEDVYGFLHGLIDTEGEFVISAGYDSISLSEDGMMVKMEMNETFTYMNLETGEALPGSYERAEDFVGDYAAVARKLSSSGEDMSHPDTHCWGMIDRSGRQCITLSYDMLEVGDNGIALVNIDGKNGFIRADGTEITGLKYTSAHVFEGGYAPVAVHTDSGGSFSGMYDLSLWGLIDEEGNEVLPCQYDSIEICSNGLLLVNELDKYGYITIEGENVTELKYDRARDFEGAYATVGYRVPLTPEQEMDSDPVQIRWGCIDAQGNEVLPPEYDNVGFHPDGTIEAALGSSRIHFEVKDGRAVELPNP